MIDFTNNLEFTDADLHEVVTEAFLATGTSDEVPKKRYVLGAAKPARPLPANPGVVNASALGNHQVGNNYQSSSIGGRNKIDTANQLEKKKKRKELDEKIAKLANESLSPSAAAQLDWANSFRYWIDLHLDQCQ